MSQVRHRRSGVAPTVVTPPPTGALIVFQDTPGLGVGGLTGAQVDQLVYGPLTIRGDGVTPTDHLPYPWYDHVLYGNFTGTSTGNVLQHLQSYPRKPFLNFADTVGKVTLTPGSDVATFDFSGTANPNDTIANYLSVNNHLYCEVWNATRLRFETYATYRGIVREILSPTSVRIHAMSTGTARFTTWPSAAVAINTTDATHSQRWASNAAFGGQQSGNTDRKFFELFGFLYGSTIKAMRHYWRSGATEATRDGRWRDEALNAADLHWHTFTASGTNRLSSYTGDAVLESGWDSFTMAAREEDRLFGQAGWSRKWHHTIRMWDWMFENDAWTRRFDSPGGSVRYLAIQLKQLILLAITIPDTYHDHNGVAYTDGATWRAKFLDRAIQIICGFDSATQGPNVGNNSDGGRTCFWARIINDPRYNIGGIPWYYLGGSQRSRGNYTQPWHFVFAVDAWMLLYRYLNLRALYPLVQAQLLSMIVAGAEAIWDLGWEHNIDRPAKRDRTTLTGVNWGCPHYAVNDDSIHDEAKDPACTVTLTPGSATVTVQGSPGPATEGSVQAGMRLTFWKDLTGTFAVTNGSTTVTGTGSDLANELVVGERILILGKQNNANADPDVVKPRVAAISGTTLTLTFNYNGLTESGVKIRREAGYYLRGFLVTAGKGSQTGQAMTTGQTAITIPSTRTLAGGTSPNYKFINSVATHVGRPIRFINPTTGAVTHTSTIATVTGTFSITITDAFPGPDGSYTMEWDGSPIVGGVGTAFTTQLSANQFFFTHVSNGIGGNRNPRIWRRERVAAVIDDTHFEMTDTDSDPFYSGWPWETGDDWNYSEQEGADYRVVSVTDSEIVLDRPIREAAGAMQTVASAGWKIRNRAQGNGYLGTGALDSLMSNARQLNFGAHIFAFCHRFDGASKWRDRFWKIFSLTYGGPGAVATGYPQGDGHTWQYREMDDNDGYDHKLDNEVYNLSPLGLGWMAKGF